MNHRPGIGKVAGIAGAIGGASALALLVGAIQIGCDSGKSSNGTGGSSGTGGAGMGGAAGGAGGNGGNGGSMAAACKDERIVATNITTDTTWECNSYVLKGLTSIADGATLTIAAGSTIYGDSVDNSNPAALVAMRGGKLIAIGTADKPIVFTSNFPAGMRVPGDSLAGVVLMGKAKINNGVCQNDGDPATPACDAPGFMQSNIEGIAANDPRGQYGGNDDTHDCGELKYVRVEFAGFLLGPDNELNGITVGACGSATKLSYLQVHRGFDDGIELFGGTASLDHIVISGPTDDGLDWDNGWRGKAQFVIVHQGYTKGDKGFEGDNLGGMEAVTPRSYPEIWNATLIGETGKIGMHLREGTRFKLRNFIVQNFTGGALDVDDVTVVPMTEWPTDMSIENSVFFGGNLSKDETTVATANNDMGFDEAAALMAAARMNQINVDPMLGSTSIAAPNYIPGNALVMNQATPPAPLDTTATYAGAVKPGVTTPWYAGWTAFPEN
ncbi:MAG: hypothetical protein ABUL67_00850 [Haliangium ochraceum]